MFIITWNNVFSIFYIFIITFQTKNIIIFHKKYKKASIENIKYKEEIKNSLLVQLGAIDSKNNLKRILNVIRDIKGNLKIITVVLSKDAPHRDEIKDILDDFNNSRLLEVNKSNDMIKLYMSHNIIIGASGVSLLERITMGIYSLSFSLNDNQEVNSQFLQKNKVGLYGGRLDILDLSVIKNTIKKFVNGNKSQFMKKEIYYELIDGKGSDRVANILKNL